MKEKKKWKKTSKENTKLKIEETIATTTTTTTKKKLNYSRSIFACFFHFISCLPHLIYNISFILVQFSSTYFCSQSESCFHVVEQSYLVIFILVFLRIAIGRSVCFLFQNWMSRIYSLAGGILLFPSPHFCCVQRFFFASHLFIYLYSFFFFFISFWQDRHRDFRSMHWYFKCSAFKDKSNLVVVHEFISIVMWIT